MAAPLFCKEERGAVEKFLIKLVSKSLQSARQRLAAYKQSSALQEKKQRPCHSGSKSCEQGRGPFNGMKKGHPGFYAWVSFFSFLREVRGRAYLLRSVRSGRCFFFPAALSGRGALPHTPLLACRLGRPLGNVPPGRSGPLKRWTKLLLVSTQLERRDPPLRNARRRLVQSGHGRLERGKWTNHPENPGNKPFL